MPASIRWICLALVVLAAPTAFASEPLTVRVLTYNIHHAANDQGEIDIARIAEVIRETRAHVVALQEVDCNVPRSGGTDQAAELAKRLDMHFVFGANIPLDGGEYGNAVLSRYPVQLRKNHVLPRHDNGEQRGLLDVEIRLQDRLTVRLLATHLDHRRDESERLESAAVINKLVAASKEASHWMLLAGDINARPESKTLEVLGKTWKLSDAQLTPTIPANSPSAKIDYIFSLGSEQRFRVIESRVIDEPSASDHRPLLVVFEGQPN